MLIRAGTQEIEIQTISTCIMQTIHDRLHKKQYVCLCLIPGIPVDIAAKDTRNRNSSFLKLKILTGSSR